MEIINEDIKTVKIQGDGYLVNGNMSVPKADGNRDYQEVKIWIEDNTPESEFTHEESMSNIILAGEDLVTTYIQIEVEKFNEANRTAFADIHAMANYKDSALYTHAKACGDLWLWNESVWMAARDAQAQAITDGLTSEEFLALLPKFV